MTSKSQFTEFCFAFKLDYSLKMNADYEPAGFISVHHNQSLVIIAKHQKEAVEYLFKIYEEEGKPESIAITALGTCLIHSSHPRFQT